MDDQISRAAAIEAIRECWQRVNKFAKPYDLTRVVECIKAIDDLPTVPAIPVEWLKSKRKEALHEGMRPDEVEAVEMVLWMWQKEQKEG